MSELDSVPSHDEALFDRRLTFLRQRTSGATFKAIAAQWNKDNPARPVSATTVSKDCDWARRHLVSEATREMVRGEHRSIILTMRQAYFPAMLGGDIDAGKMIMAGMVREAEMFGSDEPKRATVGVGSEVEFAETLIELMRLVDVEPPRDLLFAANKEITAPERVAADDRPVLDVEVDDEPPETATPAHEWSNVADE